MRDDEPAEANQTTEATVTEATVTEGAERFELRRGDELIGFATFRQQGDAVVVPHVETLLAHRDQGNAERLMDGIVEILDATDRTIVPLCPFAARYMREHPEHAALLQS